MQENITLVNVPLLDTDSLSEATPDLVGNAIVGFEMPANIEGATAITFQATGEPGGTFLNMYTAAGAELTVTVGVDQHIPVNPTHFASARFLKIRLGTSGTPVVATADRVLTVIVRPIA